jgi:hypothetical protein
MWPLLLVLLLAHCATAATPSRRTFDLLAHESLDHTWMEIGFATLLDSEWVSVVTTVTTFNSNTNTSSGSGSGSGSGSNKSLAVFLGLPEYGGASYDQGFPLVPKLQTRAERRADGSHEFRAKLVQANDSFCSKDGGRAGRVQRERQHVRRGLGGDQSRQLGAGAGRQAALVPSHRHV